MDELKIKLPSEVPAEEAQLLLAIKLFETGRLSMEEAAKLAGHSKLEFVEALSKHGTDETQ